MPGLKFKYSSTQPHQNEAVEAVCNLFEGQEFLQSEFTAETRSFEIPDEQATLFPIPEPVQGRLRFEKTGFANGIRLAPSQLEKNLHTVQEGNCIEPTTVMTDGRLRDFTIEMETGTGKTYVYERTILELHKRYGLTKFVVVVPSVAIREGVMKSFSSTQEHFDALYDKPPMDVFVYDSKKLGDVANFALSNSIQVMIINISAFNKEVEKSEKALSESEAEQDKAQKGGGNLFFRTSEKLPAGRTPQETISECRPVVIIDEPQSVDNTPKAKKAIATLNPLFVLRYSATHKERYNMLYELGPVDAFQQDLVKGICVDSVLTEEDLNGAFVRLDSVTRDPFRAKVSIDMRQRDGSQRRKTVVCKTGDNLFEKSRGNTDYEDGWVIYNISTEEGAEAIEFSNGEYLELGQSVGDVAEEAVKRAQIKRTIEDHLEKQLQMWPHGIKVLSLFFIDKVEKYRTADDEDGEYARTFDELYREAVSSPKWRRRYEKAGMPLQEDPARVREGYFSQDGRSKRLKDTNGTTSADETTFRAIMQDKEKLVSFPDPANPNRVSEIQFIWSHSALREGWDNPNVFTICTLVDTASVITKRQKIGRGLRLPVNQNGERCHDANLNMLTVVANESYREFARGLQREFEQEGVYFGRLTAMSFAKVAVEDADGETHTLGATGSKQIFKSLQESGLVDDKGRIAEECKAAAEAGELPLPEELESVREQVEAVVLTKASSLQLRNKADEVEVYLQKDVSLSPEFQALWERIRQRTTYRVDVDSDRIVYESIDLIKTMPKVRPPQVLSERAALSVEESGIEAQETGSSIVDASARSYDLPDPIRQLQDAVGLTRMTLKRILEGCGRMDEFANDPSTFLKMVTARINQAKNKEISRGIKYVRLPESEWYEMSVLDMGDIRAYLGKNAWEPMNGRKCLYNYVVYDSSTVEQPFAAALDKAEEVKVYAKLPDAFKIDTPVGKYNPDWAYVQEIDGQERVYFVIETKGGGNGSPALRPEERVKTDCAKRHFEALNDGVEYEIRTTYSNVGA